MDRYVVTGFDEQYWHRWGISWIVSLKELAKFDGNILVVNFGLSSSTKSRLADFGVYLLPGKFIPFRVGIVQAIQKFAEKYPGVFAVWDADVYFQKNIDEIFDLAAKQLVLTDSPGFYAGTLRDLSFLNELNELTLFVNSESSHQYMLEYLPNSFTKTDSSWNFTDVTSLSEIEQQKVIHPMGQIKSLMADKNIAFWERHKDLYNQYCDVKYTGTRRLVKKKFDVNKAI